MVAGLQHDDIRISHEVDQAMRLIYSPGPGSRQDVLEWLGFASAGERVAQDILNQQIDSLQRLSVLALPVGVVFPPVPVECELSAHASWSS